MGSVLEKFYEKLDSYVDITKTRLCLVFIYSSYSSIILGFALITKHSYDYFI